jgi:hypothetical protein
MVIIHLMCSGCIMSASAMVSCPSVIALIARWGALRWLADITHACIQCLLAAGQRLIKFTTAPPRSSSFALAAATSPSSPPPEQLFSDAVECMRARLIVVSDYLQSESHLLQNRPELAVQQLQHSCGALADVSSARFSAAKNIRNESRGVLEIAGEKRSGFENTAAFCIDSDRSTPLAALIGASSSPFSKSPVEATSISMSPSAAAAPPPLLLRSFSRPKNISARYAKVGLRLMCR